MDIISKQKTEQPVVKSKTLSYKEEEVMRKRLRTLEDIRDGKEIVQGLNYESKSPAEVEKEIKSLRWLLDNKSVKEAVGSERDQIWKKIKVLEEDLRKDMPDWKTYVNTKRRDGMEYIHLKNLIIKWERDPVRKQKIKDWRRYKRMIDPNDPTIANTMLLFPDKK